MESAAARIPGRRADLDWLRVGAVYLLFVFHTAKVYDPAPWYHVWSRDLIPGLQHLTGFIHLWHMPLLFLLAGWSAVVSLRRRGLAAFWRERALRLGLPLVAGIVLLCPVIKYAELRSGMSIGLDGLGASVALQEAHGALQARPLPVAPPFHEGFLEFLPSFFTPARITWSHLWFVAYLLAGSAVFSPFLFRAARRAPFPVRRPGLALWAPLALLVASEVWLRPDWPGVQTLVSDWANVAKYSIYLWAGCLLAVVPDVEAVARRQWRRAASVGVGLCVLLLLVQPARGAGWSGIVAFGAPAAAGYCLVVALLGAASRLERRSSPTLAWLAESAMPVYVLHQVGVVLAAWALESTPLPLALRVALVLVLAVAGVLLFHAGVVRRVAWLGLLLGRKGRGRQASAGAPRAVWRAATVVVALVPALGCSSGPPRERAPLEAAPGLALPLWTPETAPDLTTLPEGWRRSDFRFRALRSPADLRFGRFHGREALRLEPGASGSILFRTLDAPLASHPVLRWSWRVEREMQCECPETAWGGDDHPVGLLVKLAPVSAPEPRHKLYLVWGNRVEAGGIAVRLLGFRVNASVPYQVVRGGAARVGRWWQEEVDLEALARRHFPQAAALRVTELGVVSDADNCGGRSLAFLTPPVLRPRPAASGPS